MIEATDEPGHRLAPVLAVCTLVYLLDGLVHSILGPLAPQIAASLHMTHAEMGPVFSANLIGQSVGLIAFPLLAGRIGNRKVVIVTAAGFGTFELAAGFSTSWEALFAIRTLTGLFLGGALPTCLAIVTNASPRHRRGIVTMTLFTGYGLGATLAGLAVAVFGETGWRSAMIAVGTCSMLTAIMVWIWLRTPDRPGERGQPRNEGGATNPLRIFAPSYLLGTLMLWLLFISMLTISYCLNSWLPTLLVEVGHDQSVAAISVTTFSLGGIIAALGVGVLIDRWGATRILVAFLAISTFMLFLIGQILATASSSVLLALLGICGFFVLGAYGGVNVVLAGYYPADLRALGIGWTKSVGRIGTMVAPVLIGFALTRGIQGTTVMSLFALPAALAATAVLVVGLSRSSRTGLADMVSSAEAG
jgi:MFS family permease